MPEPLPCGCYEGEECLACTVARDPDACPPDATPSYLEVASAWA